MSPKEPSFKELFYIKRPNWRVKAQWGDELWTDRTQKKAEGKEEEICYHLFTIQARRQLDTNIIVLVIYRLNVAFYWAWLDDYINRKIEDATN